MKEKILNKYTWVQLIVHRFLLTNAKTLIHVEMESTDTVVRGQSLSIPIISIGHLDERHYVSAAQLDYYNDSIPGYEVSSVTNVSNYSEVIID